MDITRFGRVAALLLPLAAALAAAPAAAGDAWPTASADMSEPDEVLRWNVIALEAGRDATSLMQSRALAMAHAAMYDAANGVDRRFAPYVVADLAEEGTPAVAAVAAAAHTVLLELYPQKRATLDAALAGSLALLPASAHRDSAVAFGRRVGGEVVAWRARDRSGAMAEHGLPQKPGDWRPTPPAFAPAFAPHWGTVAPFLLGGGHGRLPPPPPPLESERYAKELAEVCEIGGRDSATRTADQTEACVFWTWYAPQIWSSAARQAVAARPDLSLVERARVFAMMSAAIADALSAAWLAKYEYARWRPITAIREAGDDGNRATDPDTTWTPVIETPPFPCYVSGHAVSSAAAARVLTILLGDDRASLRITNPEVGVTRSFASFSSLAHEAQEARIWSGVHFRSSQEVGTEIGRSIGEAIAREALPPIESASTFGRGPGSAGPAPRANLRD
ncbi:MAG: vanadium-dependent haloperoxidase [Candidatus Eisenbacteria bacterium]